MKKTLKRTLTNHHHHILEQIINVKYFNEDSKITLEIEQAPNGQENWRKLWEYTNNLETEKLFAYSELVQTNIITRDSLGRKVREKTINSFNNIIYSWVLDDSNLLITEEVFTNEGELLLRILKYLNAEGEVLKEMEDDDYITNYEYLNGKVANVRIYDGEELVLEENYFYDINGNEIRSLGFDKETGEEIEITRTYNANNNIAREEQLINGELSFVKLFEYDSNRELVRIESQNIIEKTMEIIEITMEK
jgi:hypothetical protein